MGVCRNDIVRQCRKPAGIASVDAANCYDSIAHAIASLIFQACGVPVEGVKTMLTAVQEMKYFLRTAYGDSKNCRGSTVEVKYQGLCQGKIIGRVGIESPACIHGPGLIDGCVRHPPMLHPQAGIVLVP